MKGKKQDDGPPAWKMTSAGADQRSALQEIILFFKRINLKINQREQDKSWRER